MIIGGCVRAIFALLKTSCLLPYYFQRIFNKLQICVQRSFVTLRYTSLHFVTLRYTSLHFVTLCYTLLHFVTLCYTLLHFVTLRYTSLHFVTLRYTSLHFVTLRYTSLHFVDTKLAVRIQPLLCLDIHEYTCSQNTHY